MVNVPITACHIAGGKGSGSYEGRRKNNFLLVFPAQFDVARWTLQRCDAPTLSNSPIRIPYGNQEKKMPSAGEIDDITFACFDDMEGKVSTALYNWYKLGNNPETGEVGEAKDCKFDCTLISAKPNGEAVKQWKLLGAWLSQLSPLGDGFDMGAKQEIVMITGTITMDGIKEE